MRNLKVGGKKSELVLRLEEYEKLKESETTLGEPTQEKTTQGEPTQGEPKPSPTLHATEHVQSVASPNQGKIAPPIHPPQHIVENDTRLRTQPMQTEPEVCTRLPEQAAMWEVGTQPKQNEPKVCPQLPEEMAVS